jgi:hypothetical protein
VVRSAALLTVAFRCADENCTIFCEEFAAAGSLSASTSHLPLIFRARLHQLYAVLAAHRKPAAFPASLRLPQAVLHECLQAFLILWGQAQDSHAGESVSFWYPSLLEAVSPLICVLIVALVASLWAG